MKAKFELSITISPEEREILQKAEGILKEICHTCSNHNQCDACPMHTICQENLDEFSTPHGILYNIQDVLDIEDEIEKVTKYPPCPYCETELECDDTYDMEYDEDGIILYHIGHCPKCNKEYQWRRSARCIQWENTDLGECEC